MKPSAITLEQYREVFNTFDQGFCIIEIVVDPAGTPIDYLFLEVNHAFESLTGLRSAYPWRTRCENRLESAAMRRRTDHGAVCSVSRIVRSHRITAR